VRRPLRTRPRQRDVTEAVVTPLKAVTLLLSLGLVLITVVGASRSTSTDWQESGASMKGPKSQGVDNVNETRGWQSTSCWPGLTDGILLFWRDLMFKVNLSTRNVRVLNVRTMH
jgi:hypothetical protein